MDGVELCFFMRVGVLQAVAHGPLVYEHEFVAH
jgi:hypothetical protein